MSHITLTSDEYDALIATHYKQGLDDGRDDERDRCLRHATAPDYGELTPEAKDEARRIAERIRQGT